MTQESIGTIPEWTLGDRLRKARSVTGLTIRDFAEEIGVSHMTVTNAEGDRRAVRRITLLAWAMKTGVSVEWLETGSAPRPAGPGAEEVCAIRDSNPEPADLTHSPLQGRAA